jgi:hypothetical protein
METFIQFIYGVLDHWLFLISNVLLVEPFMSNHIPKYSEWAEKSITKSRRARIAYCVSVLGIFIACFLAWNDEYKELEILKPKADLADDRLKTIEAQRLTINDFQTKSQNPVAVSVKMLPTVAVADRHLTEDQKRKLADALRPFANVILSIVLLSEGTGEQVRYLIDFMDAFKRAGIKPIGPSLSYSDTESEKGVLIGVHDEDHPSDLSIKFRNALQAAGLNVRFMNSAPDLLVAGAEFNLFVR